LFEVYRPRSGDSNDKEPMISLSKNSIVLNKKCRELLNSPELLEIAYDNELNMLRIKSSDTGLKLKKTKLYTRNLFNHFNIDKKGKFKAIFEENENALYVDLNEMPVTK